MRRCTTHPIGLWFFFFGKGGGGFECLFSSPLKNSKFSISFSMCEIWLMFSIKVVLYMSLHIEFLFYSQQSIWTICIWSVLFWVKGVVSDFFPFWGHRWLFCCLDLAISSSLFPYGWRFGWESCVFFKLLQEKKGKRKLDCFWRVNITICVGWYNIPKKLCSSLFIL